MFKLFSKNFLDDLWANLQILASIDDFQSNEVIIESKSGILIDALLKINYPKIKNKKVLNINDFLEDILYDQKESLRTKFELIEDSHNMNWIILNDENPHNLFSSMYTVINALLLNNSIKSIIGFVIKLTINYRNIHNETIYLIYRMDTKSFYPFCPTSEETGEQNREKENLIYNYLRENKFKLENNKKKWLGIWGIPF
ncbi:MAG: hypothetical protein CL775_01820 [Chloroflexi bacterium]|nr:hypothetical protein [Chloroflexota bacterium]|tara:strand:- start:307 stop:903 length:597 start_codon:yes stop_codon:yes gene_type:complete